MVRVADRAEGPERGSCVQVARCFPFSYGPRVKLIADIIGQN
jgi:hypothetical protein